MVVKYEVTKQDYIDFNLNFIETSRVMRRSLFVKRFLYPVFFLAFASLLDSVFDIPLTVLLIAVAIVSVVWILTYVKWFKRSITKKVSKLLDSGRVPGLIGAHELELGEGHLTDRTQESSTRYEAVENIQITESHIFVYVSDVMAYMVPKKAFESQERMATFLEKLKQYKATSKG